MGLLWRGGCRQWRRPVGPAISCFFRQGVLHLFIDSLTVFRVRIGSSWRGWASTSKRRSRQASSTSSSSSKDIPYHLNVHWLFFLGPCIQVSSYSRSPTEALQGQVRPSRRWGWGTRLIKGHRQLGIGASPGFLWGNLPAGLTAFGSWLLGACFLTWRCLCPWSCHAELGAGVSPGLSWGSPGAAVLREPSPRPTTYTVHAAHRVAGERAWGHGAAAGVRGVFLGRGHRHETHPEGSSKRGNVSHSNPRPWDSPRPHRACGGCFLTGAPFGLLFFVLSPLQLGFSVEKVHVVGQEVGAEGPCLMPPGPGGGPPWVPDPLACRAPAPPCRAPPGAGGGRRRDRERLGEPNWAQIGRAHV